MPEQEQVLIPLTPKDAARRCLESSGGNIPLILPKMVDEKLAAVQHLVMNFYGVVTEFGEDDFLDVISSEELVSLEDSRQEDPASANQDLSNPWAMRSIRSQVDTPDAGHVRAAVENLQRKGVTRAQIVKAVRSLGLGPRDGFRDLLSLYDGCFIVSPGIDLVIESFLEQNGLRVPVAATRLTFDEDGAVNGFDEETIAAGYRCKEALRRFSGADSRELGRSPLPGEVIPSTSIGIVGGIGVDPDLFSHATANVLFLAPGTFKEQPLVDLLRTVWGRLHLIVISDGFNPLMAALTANRFAIVE